MQATVPRILLAASKSGEGKTWIACGLLRALLKKKIRPVAFKCGPDYIDPMFHKTALGIDSYNLDTFLCGSAGVRQILAEHAADALAVLEGVMGYYDGLGGVSTQASTYEVADATQTPVVLIVDCRGASLSVAAHILGFLRYREKDGDHSHIRGVILNRISPSLYPGIRAQIEQELPVKVYGYVPVMDDMTLESRYLGLKTPGEIADIDERLKRLGQTLSETLDLDGLLSLAQTAPPLPYKERAADTHRDAVRIGVARDEAFCFCYRDNLELFRRLGAELVFFSPLKDERLPEGLSGVVFYGGYPELYAETLCKNRTMRESVRSALAAGMPCIAECGGFQYLQERLEDSEGRMYEMAGFLKGESRDTKALRRFGYVTLSGKTIFGKEAGEIPAHEFHYYDSTDCGEAFEARKPLSERAWRCMVSTNTLLAGYPHLHYAGCPQVAEAFVEACRRYSPVRM